ncbi:MAG TPA: hypothetical protein VHA35_24925 [Dongiaceae bacterium]|jgi:hypothetical protein|nr:hypothetical protein [Dongiaceae bacterium]
MVELRYPLSALAFDYLRGIVGLGIAVLIIQAVGTDTPVFWVFVGLAVLFLVWLGNTFLRHMSRIRFDQDGLTSAPWPRKSIAWNGLTRMELRYYTTKRRKKNTERDGEAAPGGRDRGWMTLTLRSERDRIDIESTLPHFADIVARAAHAAREAHLQLDQVTIENLSAIGVKGEA